MGYADFGYGWYQVGETTYDNFSVKPSGTHTGLCILKYTYNGGKYQNIVCGDKTPLYKSDPDGVYFDVNNWINEGHSSLYFRSEWTENMPTETYSEDGMYQRNNAMYSMSTIYQEKFWSKFLPIFTVTDDDRSAFNNYLETGDDSGADNYEDLHPTKLHTTVWFDGKYPAIYHKTEVIEGEYSGNINLKVVANVSSQSPTETYNGNNKVDTMQYMTFADYGNIESVTEFEFLFCRSDKSQGSVQDVVAWTCALDFGFDKNTGDYIQPTIHDSRNGNHTISFEEGVPSDKDYEDENDEWKHDQTHNSFSGANTLTKTYKLNDTQIRALGNFLWSSTFKDNIFSLTQYPLDNVVSLKAMPITVGGNEEEIKIGNVNTGINGNVVSLADGIETTVGECVVSRVFNNFIDYTDFEMFIYLPFIGFKSIDPSLCMNRRLRVKYYFDVILGNCLATLEMADMNGKFILYNIWQANCGIDIAITATNRAQIENGYIGSALNAVGSILSKNPLSLLGDVFKATTQEFHSESNGVGNPSLMNKLDTTCYIFVKRPQKYKPSNYGHYFGIPNYRYVESLSSCHGFTKTHGFVCSQISKATDEEKAEIENLLNSGIYIM